MAGNAKRLAVYTITDREGQDKGWWTRIGTAFTNKDGSLNLYLDALPTNGRIHVREDKPREDAEPEAEPEQPAPKRGLKRGGKVPF